MKKLYKVLVLVLLLTLCSLSFAFSGEVIDRIQKRGSIIIGTSGNQPPLTMVDRNGRLIGLDMDLARIVAAAMDVEPSIKKMDFGDLIPALEAGQIDMIISGMTITPERNLRVAYVGPYFVTGKGILTKSKNAERMQNVTSLNNPDVTIAVLRNSTSEAFIRRFITEAKVLAPNSLDIAVQALIRGDADVVFADYHSCAVFAMQYKNEGLVAGLGNFTYDPLGIAVPASDPLFINWLENFLFSMQGSGDLGELGKRWFQDSRWLEQLP
jgi:polar amino acid transport system substrate-binding protein